MSKGVFASMLGFLFNQKECKEFSYILRKELDEMLYDLHDHRLDNDMKQAIELRYKVIFRMYARVAPPSELSKYARNRGVQKKI
jgi:hypothetical protein